MQMIGIDRTDDDTIAIEFRTSDRNHVTSSKRNVHSHAENGISARKSVVLEQREPTEALPWATGSILCIFAFFCAVAITIGVLLNLDSLSWITKDSHAYGLSASSILAVFYFLLSCNAVFNVLTTYKPAYKKLLEYQQNQNNGDGALANDDQNDGSPLQQVVASPGPSRSVTIYHSHGSSDNDATPHFATTDRSYTPAAVNEAGDGVKSSQADLQRQGERNSDLDLEAGGHEQSVQHPRLPTRQYTASTTEAGPLEVTAHTITSTRMMGTV